MTDHDALKAMNEAVAKIVYEAMRFDREIATPEWVDRGNSTAADRARDAARDIAALQAAQPAAGDVVAALQSAAATETKLREAIDALIAKSTPYGPTVIENGEEYAQAYLLPAGPLHRLMGIVRS